MIALKKVLHVDDDEDIRAIVKLSLEVVGDLTVKQCASGPDALRIAPEFQPQLFLLDVMMPNMSGEETRLELIKIPGMKNIPTIFMTAKAQTSETRELLELGAMAVITKPFDPMVLCSDIKSFWDTFHEND